MFGIGSGEIKIAVKIQNEEKLKELTKDLRVQEEAIRKLNASYKGIAGSQQQFVKAARPFAHSIAATTKEIEKLKKETKSMDPGRFGLGLMALGNLADDAQYGFRSIVNNIPQVVYLMGGSAGVAGAAAIAAVAVNQLVEHWDQLANVTKSLATGVSLEYLEKMRTKAVEAGEAFDDLMKVPNIAMARQVKGIGEAFTQGGGGPDVFRGVAEAIAQGPDRADLTAEQQQHKKFLEDVVAGKAKAYLHPEDFMDWTKDILGGKAIKDAMKGKLDVTRLGPNPAMPFQRALGQEEATKRALTELRRLADLIQEQNRQKAKEIIGGASRPGEEFENYRSTLRRLIKEFPGAFSEEFKHAMEHTGPEIIREMMKREPQNALDAAEAARLYQGRLGTRMLMGNEPLEPVPRGPETAESAEGRLRHHALLRRLKPRARAAIAKHLVGLSGEQADEVMRRMTPGAIQGEADKNFAGQVGFAANDLMRRTAEEVGKMKIPPAATRFQKDLAAEGKRAGALGDTRGHQREMMRQREEEIRDLMQGRGLNRKQAEYELLRGRGNRLQQMLGQQSQWIGGAEFARFSSANNLNQMQRLPEISQQILKELVEINKALTDRQRKADADGQQPGNAVPPG